MPLKQWIVTFETEEDASVFVDNLKSSSMYQVREYTRTEHGIRVEAWRRETLKRISEYR